jgi:hypothetical protein
MKRLFPPGTCLADVPDDFHGVSVREWLAKCAMRQSEEAAAARSAGPCSDVEKLPLSTPRDRYGMRGMPAGTRYLGPQDAAKPPAAKQPN